MLILWLMRDERLRIGMKNSFARSMIDDGKPTREGGTSDGLLCHHDRNARAFAALSCTRTNRVRQETLRDDGRLFAGKCQVCRRRFGHRLALTRLAVFILLQMTS